MQDEVILVLCVFKPLADEILLSFPLTPSTFPVEDALRVLLFILKVEWEREQFSIHELWKEALQQRRCIRQPQQVEISGELAVYIFQFIQFIRYPRVACSTIHDPVPGQLFLITIISV